MRKTRLKGYDQPQFKRARYVVVVEPVHGGALITIENESGTAIDKCVVPLQPKPIWFPFRIVRWAVVLVRGVLRVHFAPEGGWEPLEQQRDARNKKKEPAAS